MVLLMGPLLLAGILGYLAQSTGLCMVRGIIQWTKGQPAFLLVMLFSGSSMWIAALAAYTFALPIQVNRVEISISIALGGLLYGLGTGFNHGCGVSTLSRLSRGHLTMLSTILGWLVGWCLLSYWPSDIVNVSAVAAAELPLLAVYTLHFVLFIGLCIWAFVGDSQRRKLCFSMLGIGLMAGFLFLYQSRWPPSALLQDLSIAFSAKYHAQQPDWPALSRYGFMAALLCGMLVAAWRSQSFAVKLDSPARCLMHFLSGVLMGIGASLALGGNDAQLMISLPSLSPAAFVALPAMLLGIWLALLIKNRSWR
jgi:uncharacterized membrane protein YedE/YeeE